MKENRIEDRINNAYCFLNSMHSDFRTALYYKEDLENLEHILSAYKRVLKENEELKKSKITYEAVRDIQEKNRNIVDNNYISKQIVKDNLIKYQEEYELLLEHQSGKESNRTKYLRGRIHMCQELLEGIK